MRIFFNIKKSNLDNKYYLIKLLKRKFIYKTKDSFLLLLSEVYLNKIYHTQLNIDDPIIFDLGANIGLTSSYYREVFKNAKIHSFEANPLAYKILEYNNKENNLQLKTYNVALGSNDSERDFYFTLDDHVGASFFSSRSNDQGNKITVKQERLSNFIHEEIDILKIDVEGAEMEIIKELNDTDKLKYIKNVIVEFHCNIKENSNSLINFLQIFEKNNFKFNIHNPSMGTHRVNDFHSYLIYLVRQ